MARAAADFAADYYETLLAGHLPVMSQAQPGFLRRALPAAAPERGESWQAVLRDIKCAWRSLLDCGGWALVCSAVPSGVYALTPVARAVCLLPTNPHTAHRRHCLRHARPPTRRTLIVPGLTHWQHPSFFAYFPCCARSACPGGAPPMRLLVSLAAFYPSPAICRRRCCRPAPPCTLAVKHA